MTEDEAAAEASARNARLGERDAERGDFWIEVRDRDGWTVELRSGRKPGLRGRILDAVMRVLPP